MKMETNDAGNVTLYETEDGWIRMEYENNNVIKYEDSTGKIYNCEYDCDGNRTLYESNDNFFVKRGYENGVLVNTRTVGFSSNNSAGYLFLGDDNPGCCGNYEGVHSADFVGDFHRFMVYNQVLTDQQIATNAQQSERGRNWFDITWTTPAIIINYELNKQTRWNTKLFGTIGNRNSVGFMQSILVKDVINPSTNSYANRVINLDQYRNYGLESRFITAYQLGKQDHNISFGVRGNCGMCKTTIEKAANSVEGVATATWDVDLKKIAVSFNDAKTDALSIHNAIAASGYDTETVLGNLEAYNSLPGCCQYDHEMAMNLVAEVK